MDAKPILLIGAAVAVFFFVKGKATTGGTIGAKAPAVNPRRGALQPITGVKNGVATPSLKGLQPITGIGYPADEGGPPLQ